LDSSERYRTFVRGRYVVLLVCSCALSLCSLAQNPPPSLISVNPALGPVSGGTSVLVSGANFMSGATLVFGSVPATNVVVVDNGTITATTPTNPAGLVSVSVTNPDSQSATLPNGFTYDPPPSLTSVSPGSGPAGGGTAVTVLGANFSNAATLTFGGVPATNVIVANSGMITATTPPNVAGAANVTVTNLDGQMATLTNAFTYNPPPTLASVSPPSGSTNGGTVVALSGSGFLDGITVNFGNSPLTNITVASDTVITATTPANSAGSTNVTVTNPDGQSASYVTLISPLLNAGFELGKADWSANSSGSSKVVSNASQAHTGSDFAQLTSTPGNHPTYTATSSGSQYIAVAPGNIITFGGWISLLTGNGNVRWTIQLVDANQANPTYVFTSNATANAWTLLEKTYTVPAGKAWLRFYCEIYNNTAQAQANFDDAILQIQVAAPLYTYLSPPAILSVSPNTGNTIGGTGVTISGANFVSGAGVSFGAAAAQNVTVANAGTITAIVPGNSPGASNVTVVNPDGDSATLVNGYIYIAPPAPTLTAVTPAVGSANGGNSVTITGANFLVGATVTFGGLNVGATVVNAATITAIAPANQAGAVNITVTNPDGQFATLASAYTYTAQPSVSAAFFGLHFHRPTDVPTVSYGTCRIWAVSGAFWPQIEPAQGEFDFSVLDSILADAKQAGINDGCIFTLGPTPAWASSNPTDPNCDYFTGGCWPPGDLAFDGSGTDQTVIDAITAVASHVNDPTYLQTHAHILYWEPWNEAYRGSVISGTVCSPTHLCSYNGSYAQLVRMAEDFRSVIKNIDPTALIATPSGNAYFQVNGQLVVANFLNCSSKPRAGSGCTTGNRGSNAVDVINTHCYVWSQNPDDVVTYIQQMRSFLSPTDLSKPFLCDEGGWGTNSTTPDPDLQAGFVARWFIDIASQNVTFAAWYAWDDAAWGTLWNPKGKGGCTQAAGCLTSAGTAYQQVNAWLVGATLGNCTASASITTCPLSNSNGYQGLLVWVNTTLPSCAGQSSSETCGSTAYPVPSQYITKCDLAGTCQPAQSVETIGAKPLLFQNQ